MNHTLGSGRVKRFGDFPQSLHGILLVPGAYGGARLLDERAPLGTDGGVAHGAFVVLPDSFYG